MALGGLTGTCRVLHGWLVATGRIEAGQDGAGRDVAAAAAAAT